MSGSMRYSIVHKYSLGRRARSRGLTLIEILITLLVISIGLLGVAGLHSFSMKSNYDALMRSHASVLVADIADRMRANREAVADYVIAVGETPEVTEESTRADADLAEWKATLDEQLPSGDGSITFDAATSNVTIRVEWGERGADDPIFFETETEV